MPVVSTKNGSFFLVLDSRALLILLNIIYCSSVSLVAHLSKIGQKLRDTYDSNGTEGG